MSDTGVCTTALDPLHRTGDFHITVAAFCVGVRPGCTKSCVVHYFQRLTVFTAHSIVLPLIIHYYSIGACDRVRTDEPPTWKDGILPN